MKTTFRNKTDNGQPENDRLGYQTAETIMHDVRNGLRWHSAATDWSPGFVRSHKSAKSGQIRPLGSGRTQVSGRLIGSKLWPLGLSLVEWLKPASWFPRLKCQSDEYALWRKGEGSRFPLDQLLYARGIVTATGGITRERIEGRPSKIMLELEQMKHMISIPARLSDK